MKKTNISGLYIINQKVFNDKRGKFIKAFSKDFVHKKINTNFKECYFTKSKKNVIRGIHFQDLKGCAKFVFVLSGKVIDVVIDLRRNSKTFGKHFCINISDKNGISIYIPPGFAHGFVGLEKENIISYHCTNLRSEKHEMGILWNDNDLKIKWPTKKPIISTKDKKNISLKEYLKNA